MFTWFAAFHLAFLVSFKQYFLFRNFQLCPFFSHHMKACCHTDPSARSEMTKHYPHFMF